MRVNKRGIGYVALLSLLILSVTGVSASSMGQLNGVFGRIDAAVESGELTQEQADAKRQQITEGRKQFAQKGMRGSINPEDIARRLQTAVESGKLTQEQADAKRQQITEGRKQFGEKSDRMQIPSEKIGERRIQEGIDSGKLTQEQANARRGARTSMNKPFELGGVISRVQVALNGGMPLEAMQLRIQTSVDRGRLTEEQADSIWANLGVATTH